MLGGGGGPLMLIAARSGNSLHRSTPGICYSNRLRMNIHTNIFSRIHLNGKCVLRIAARSLDTTRNLHVNAWQYLGRRLHCRCRSRRRRCRSRQARAVMCRRRFGRVYPTVQLAQGSVWKYCSF